MAPTTKAGPLRPPPAPARLATPHAINEVPTNATTRKPTTDASTSWRANWTTPSDSRTHSGP